MKNNYDFRPNQRIKRKKEFQQLYEKSFRIYGGSFIYRFCFSKNSRLGISVSKKFGNAVYRNSIKRMIREEFRHKEFPYSLDLLISQSKPFHKKNPKNEIKLVFKILSDWYILQQASVSPLALSSIQLSKHKISLLSKCLFNIILFYKRVISKNLTPSCRYTPSCSVYALEALRIYSFWKAIYLIIKRLLSCHPLGGEGYNPVPKKFNKYKNKSKNKQ